jgi:hypothetical protein
MQVAVRDQNDNTITWHLIHVLEKLERGVQWIGTSGGHDGPEASISTAREEDQEGQWPAEDHGQEEASQEEASQEEASQ